MPLFVSDQGIHNLDQYQYSGVDLSLIVKYILAPFYWNPLVKLLPKNLAPNVITLFGGCLMVLSMFAMNFFDKPGEPINKWVALFTSIMIFLYQTADNLDGKQARRTNSSSALGELFDHGVDSIMIGIFAVTVAHSFQYSSLITSLFTLLMMVVFYLSHFEEYHVGVLVLGYIINPTELQVGTIGLILFEGFFPSIGLKQFGLTVNSYISLFVLCGSIVGIGHYLFSVSYHVLTKTKQQLGVVMSQLIPFSMFIILSALLLFSVCGKILDEFFWLFIWIFTMMNAYLTQRIVVKRICKEQIQYFDFVLLIYALFVLLVIIVALIQDSLVIIIAFYLLAFICVFEIIFVCDTCKAFAEYLHIQIFHINKEELPN